ncbi:MAG: hypothetical protein AAFY78_02100 [Cyanobacteria bacterium J06648_16]
MQTVSIALQFQAALLGIVGAAPTVQPALNTGIEALCQSRPLALPEGPAQQLIYLLPYLLCAHDVQPLLAQLAPTVQSDVILVEGAISLLRVCPLGFAAAGTASSTAHLPPPVQLTQALASSGLSPLAGLLTSAMGQVAPKSPATAACTPATVALRAFLTAPESYSLTVRMAQLAAQQNQGRVESSTTMGIAGLLAGLSTPDSTSLWAKGAAPVVVTQARQLFAHWAGLPATAAALPIWPLAGEPLLALSPEREGTGWPDLP